jgi:hypothetical protein
MPQRDKTQEYVTEHDTYKIIMFWHPGKKDSYGAGWHYKIIDK